MPEMNIRDALRQTIREALLEDEKVILMGEDIGAYGGSYGVTRGLLQEFGDKRVRDTPIAESAVVGCGIGAAMGGLRPIVELMTINFSFLAIDQIINVAAPVHYMSGGQINVPLVIRMASGGGSQLGATHSHDLAGWYAHVPGLRVATPSTPYDARGLLKTALAERNTTIFVEHTAIYGLKGEVPEEEYSIPFGRAQIMREGTDVTIIGYSGSVHQAMRAAQMLADRGMEAEVVNLRTLRPLDVPAITNSVKKTTRAIVVEDDWRFGGFAGEIVALIQENAFDYLDAPIARVCGADVPTPYAKVLETAALPSEQQIVDAALAMR